LFFFKTSPLKAKGRLKPDFQTAFFIFPSQLL